MQDLTFECLARIEEKDDTESSGLILRLRPDAKRKRSICTVADRLSRAAEWVMDVDAQFVDLVQAGQSPQVTVPVVSKPNVGRVRHETPANYRRLQLGIGELIRPLLLDPPDLKQLYPFQRRGVEWLSKQSGGILADDMGLGKTVQVVAAVRLLINRGELRDVLVVCPKGLIATWEREIRQWAPELGLAIVTPPAQIREDAWKAVAGRCHVLLTNYEQLRVPPAVLSKCTPDLIVADEAHRLRNRSARITSGSFQLRPKRFWALTGTPLERDLDDLTTLLSLVVPSRFAPTDAKLHPSSLRSRARPYVLRRRKQEVLDDLPPVLDTTDMLELSDAQERAYRAVVRQYRRTREKGGELALLTRLQTLCDMDAESRESSKVERILHLLGRIREHQEKAVVFSHRLEPLRELHRRVTQRWGENAVALLVGEMGSEERERAVTHFRSSDGQMLALLASTRIGGEGLTLVEANHVFLFNQWWNPSANDQARDRVVRIGQRRKVRVYRFCCRGTIEEALDRILRSKRELFDDAVERLAVNEGAVWTRVLGEVGMERLMLESTPVASQGSAG